MSIRGSYRQAGAPIIHGSSGSALLRLMNHGLSCGLSHIMADFCQIMWRKFLRNLCKYSTMAQKVLPHNLAWPFLPFLPSCCRPLSTAILCGRKRLMAPKVAPMLRQMVLPDNVAPPIFSQIFVGADTKIYDQHIFGWSRHIIPTAPLLKEL